MDTSKARRAAFLLLLIAIAAGAGPLASAGRIDLTPPHCDDTGCAAAKPSDFTIKLPWDDATSHTIINAYGTGLHQGVCRPGSANDYHALDFDLSTGQNVRAVAGGRVVYAGWATGGWSSYGQIVIIDHQNGYQSMYAHLSVVSVSDNQWVQQKEKVGEAGGTGGWSPHLHLALYHDAHVSDPGGPYGGCSTVPERFHGAQEYEDLVTGMVLTSEGGGDSTPPDGDITSPSEGAVIGSRAVYLGGWAADNPGGSGFNHAHFTADFGSGWRQVGPDFTSSPFGFDWDLCAAGVPDGPVTLGLDIWDNAGNGAYSPRGNRHFTKSYDCSASCNPGADQIALFVDANYSGQCVVKGVGEYPNPAAIGLPNDAISSIKVGGSVQALLCRDDNYGSTCETLTGDDPNLSDNPVGNDQVSSAKVEWRACSPGADQAALYADAGYGGACVVLNVGDYPHPDGLGAVGNDNAEAVRVGSNVQAVLCQHDNYEGTCETFTGDDPDLGDNAIGRNVVSSARVQTRPPARPDLYPYAPAGYPAAVVPSSIVGTHETNTLYAGHYAYFDWHWINGGTATAEGSFHVDLWVDDVRYVHYPFSDYGAGWGSGFDDWAEVIPTAGQHTVRLVVDPDDTIAESDEGNNVWEGQFYWAPVDGWWGEYYNDEDLEGSPALVRDDSKIDFDWAYGSPGPGVNGDSFSARWTASVYFDGGSYLFIVTHDDGARLWLDGALVMDEWGSCCRDDTVEVTLSGGRHTVRMDYYEHDGAAVARLSWVRQGGPYRAFLPMARK